MNIEDKIRLSLLLDYYGKLLKESQKKMLDLKINEDLSLQEISDIMGITRQGVRDSINRGIKLLNDYEDKIALQKKQSLLYNDIKSIKDFIVNGDNQEALNKIDAIIGSLEED